MITILKTNVLKLPAIVKYEMWNSFPLRTPY